MLEKFKEMLKKERKDVLKIDMPRHIAITMDGINEWATKNEVSLEEANKKSFLILKSTINTQVKLNIPITTFYILPEYEEATEEFTQLMNTTAEFFESIASSDLISKNKIKISVLGKWYDLPSRIVDIIKKAIDVTKDYDNFFVNFCINYCGQEEIVDACKLIGMQIKTGKLDPDSINKELIKESIYSSYFLPPDLVIKNGTKKETSGLLLWDSMHSQIYFTNKSWPDFDRTEFMDAIKEFQKGK
jgi:undecaprenyl diphosphate synthase